MYRPTREISFGSTSQQVVGQNSDHHQVLASSCTSSGNNAATTCTAEQQATNRWSARCSSLNAREAMTILTLSHDVASMIPGPFVVMQGTPGDGMANTIDSMPELIFGHRPNVHPGSGSGSSSNSMRINNHQNITNARNSAIGNIFRNAGIGVRGGAGAAAAAASNIQNISSSTSEQDGTNASSCISIPSDLPYEIPHLSSAGSLNSIQTDDCINIGIPSGGDNGRGSTTTTQDDYGHEEGGNASDGEIVDMMGESMTSDVSLEMVHVDASATNDPNSNFASTIVASGVARTSTESKAATAPATKMTAMATSIHQQVSSSSGGLSTPRMSNMHNSNEFQNKTQMERGLHLPLPPSAVSIAAMGMGYNSFLPPVAPSSSGTSPKPEKRSNSAKDMNQTQTTGANANATTTTQSSKNNQQQPSNTMFSDSFVLINDNENGDDNIDQNIEVTPSEEGEAKAPSSLATSFPERSSNDEEEAISLSSHTQSSNIDIGRTTSTNSNPRYANVSMVDRRAIQQWKHSCRDNEYRLRKEMIGDAATTPRNQQHTFLVQDQWWITKGGCLAVFETLPILSTASNSSGCSSAEVTSTDDDRNDQNVISTSRGNQIQFGSIIGEVSPGSALLATEIHNLDENLLQKSDEAESMDDEQQQANSACTSKYQILKIESPIIGYVVYSFNGYCYLGPGLPMYYVEPEVWMWRVMCTGGAFVRQGLELTSVQTETVPFGSIVRATRKTINSMGLSRVLIDSSLPMISQVDGDRGKKSSGFIARLRNRGNDSSVNDDVEYRRFSGWVSEALNPLSGQRGKIIQSIPFPVPALYRVTLTDGAVIRSGIELSSPQIGHAPIGSILTVVGRAYSEHPADRCLERLKLAGSGGWVSVRLNRSPPRDYLVVELVGIDGRFDPNEAGLYHIERQRQVLQECYNNNSQNETETQNLENVRQSLHRLSTISSIEDEDQGGNLENSGELSNTCSSLTSAAVPTLYRSGVAGGSVTSQSVKACGSKSQKDEHCLICLTEQRSATIVHGETGHIACCLACARILKARGDKVSFAKTTVFNE